ncbi:sigma 54-interacting transcriptional regulator [Bacillus sp. MUM 13]|uniref:sigma-54 interaction domain-containing protein n=1 Tax=Bacillus sp. MUM 13 TaxID=1678001 RepID=UPI0008F5BAEA|nr:sigma 54-interacting transcriptional regulator [Bacillus sp. MUM 13]OIK09492.1 sigma-54-dependent Fis family transcriptional regulator [Bacillus sp. MUM 13]
MQEEFNTNEVLEAILKSIDEGIHVVGTDGRTIFYNEVAANHDGMKANEVLGKPLLSVFPSLTRHSSTLLQVLQTGEPIIHKSQTYLNLHGRKIETMNTTLPIKVGEELIGAVEIAKDFSKLKVLSERLLDLEHTLKTKPAVKTGTSGAFFTFKDILTENIEFRKKIEQAKKAALADSPVLIYGESGTGKELFVQSIHNESKRRNGPFIAQNCAALPEALLESLLFGTAKGSYTGAVERGGLFELANGGTLFLDELQSMPVALQAKLLRVLEDGMVRRIGGSKSIKTDVRVMAAMNIPPSEAVKENLLRGDLYYRLNVMSYELPPLRERKEDILMLSHHFMNYFNEKFSRNVTDLTQAVRKTFIDYQWPGNVRELKHTIEFMINQTETQQLQNSDLPVSLQAVPRETPKFPEFLPLREAVRRTESQLIEKALAASEGNILKASRLLDIPRQTLQYKIQKGKK